MEGHCDQNCLHNMKGVVALWQVQKIRHRDGGHRKFSYEMKFSISALKSNLNEQNSERRNLQRNFIQREDDYPQSFGRIIYPDDEEFAERFTKSTDVKPSTLRNSQIKPEATFLESFLLPPPPAYTKQLNIGEYLRDSTEKGISKIELFPNVFNAHFPHKHLKLPSEKNAFGAPSLLLNDTTPMVMHHYHHHFYMPNSLSLENELSSAEHLSLAETDLDRIHLHNPQLLPPAPQKHLNGQIEPQKIVHIGSMHQIQPLPFFPIKLNQPQLKPFIQSDKLDEPVYYSEPDPLYPPELITFETDKTQFDEHTNDGNATNLVETTSQNSNDLLTTTTTKSSETITINKPTTTRSNTVLKPTRSPNFVSTSTTQHAVRAASRYRKNYRSPATTTERPVKKWRSKLKNGTTTITTSESESKLNKRKIYKVLSTTTPVITSTLPVVEKFPTTTTTDNEITTVATVPTTAKNEVYEILTKKSVSKSVSIKVGQNGEELPVNADHQNEVQQH